MDMVINNDCFTYEKETRSDGVIAVLGTFPHLSWENKGEKFPATKFFAES
jgi:hypothetical protein